jgi:hypothetical protein
MTRPAVDVAASARLVEAVKSQGRRNVLVLTLTVVAWLNQGKYG